MTGAPGMDDIRYADLQVNGAMGVDFSSPELTDDQFLRAVEHIFATGTYLFLPTLVTSPKDVYFRNVALMRQAVVRHGLSGRIPGVHLEGPFISLRPGAVGAHDPANVSAPDIGFFDELMERSCGYVKLMTIAAEIPGMAEFISHASERGVIISCGHQLARSGDLEVAAAAGAKLLTHLGNGCPNLLDRHDNPILSGMACDKLAAMIIADGHHLPPELIKCIIRVKGPERVIVTSDAAPIAGLPPGHYNCWNNDAVLEPDGLFHNPAKGCLVGSSASIRDCANYLRTLDFVSEADIVKMTSENPLALISGR